MLAYIFVVLIDLALWALFFDLVPRNMPETMLWVAFGLALAGLIWLLNEALTLATAKIGQSDE